MNTIVEEAKMWGRKACAHAHGAEAIKMAVKAGVASIEHGSLVDEEGIQLMKQHGTYLVSDIYDDDHILSEYSKLGYPDKVINKEKMVGKLQRENFAKAVKAGVKIAFGTDAGVYPHGWNGKQFYYTVKYGLTPMQPIQSSTINAADLLNWKEKTGSISKGKAITQSLKYIRRRFNLLKVALLQSLIKVGFESFFIEKQFVTTKPPGTCTFSIGSFNKIYQLW